MDKSEVTANSIYINEDSRSALDGDSTLTDHFIGTVLKEIVSDHVILPLCETKDLLKKAEGAIMPLTVTLYRRIAYRKFKAKIMEKLN